MKTILDQSMNRLNTTCDNNRSFTQSQQPKGAIFTSVLDREEQKCGLETVKIDFLGIKLPAKKETKVPVVTPRPNDVAAADAFSYEKQRLQLLGIDKLAKFQEEGPNADVDLCDPQVVSFQAEQRQELGKDHTEVEKWALFLKALAIGVACLEILSAALSMLFLFLLALKTSASIVKTALPLIFNILTSISMLNMAIKGGGLSNLETVTAAGFKFVFWYCAGSVFAFLVEFILMAGVRSIPEIMSNLGDLYVSDSDPRKDEKIAMAYENLVYLVVWLFSIFNFGMSALIGVFAFLLRYSLRKFELHQLEQQALPLGYQIHSKLCSSQTTSAPPVTKM